MRGEVDEACIGCGAEGVAVEGVVAEVAAGVGGELGVRWHWGRPRPAGCDGRGAGGVDGWGCGGRSGFVEALALVLSKGFEFEGVGAAFAEAEDEVGLEGFDFGEGEGLDGAPDDGQGKVEEGVGGGESSEGGS